MKPSAWRSLRPRAAAIPPEKSGGSVEARGSHTGSTRSGSIPPEKSGGSVEAERCDRRRHAGQPIPPEKSGGSVEARSPPSRPVRPSRTFRLRNQAAPLKLSGWIWKWGLLRSFRLRNQAAPLKLNLQDRLFHLNPVIPPEKSGGSVEASPLSLRLPSFPLPIPPEKSGGSVEATLDHHSHTPNL